VEIEVANSGGCAWRGRSRISLVLNNDYITANPEFAMLPMIAEHRAEIAALCRRFGVLRLAVFGSAARGADFDPARSDVDFLVEFAAQDGDFARLLDFKQALEVLLARRVDLVDRKAIEASRNYIRKRHILTGAEPVYAA
jgi:hypothetical protein